MSVNPFEYITELYTAEQMNFYRDSRLGADTPPHIFSIAADAVKGLADTDLNQSIIIRCRGPCNACAILWLHHAYDSGESGAGKTEATKKCMQVSARVYVRVMETDGIRCTAPEQYFAHVAAANDAIVDKILAPNPILEAFGNAKTVRNDNSSRFGKWIAVQFDDTRTICGTRIVNYLLEKSRVVVQARGERNFHVFYQLCGGADRAMREKLGLRSAGAYDYLTGGDCMTIDGGDDETDLDILNVAFRDVGFRDEERNAMYEVRRGSGGRRCGRV